MHTPKIHCVQKSFPPKLKFYLLDDETVAERLDVQHLKQGGLGSADLLADLDQVDIVLKSANSIECYE